MGKLWSRFRKWLKRVTSEDMPRFKYDDDFIDSIQFDLWACSPERKWYVTRRPRVFAYVVGSVMAALLAALVGQPPRSAIETWWAIILAMTALISLCYSTFPYWAARRGFIERRRKKAAIRAELALKKIPGTINRDEKIPGTTDADGMPLTNLFRYNRRQLDAYQEESRNQQRVAFRHAQFASLAGLLVLIIGIAVSLSEAPGSDKYVVAGLSGLGAALSGYVARTFFSSARQADRQLNFYYQEPHMMGRLILAERITKELCKENEEEMDKFMVTQVLTWPLPDVRETGSKPLPDVRETGSNGTKNSGQLARN
jgi:hypothetical protein